jgi:hypothetical protein
MRRVEAAGTESCQRRQLAIFRVLAYFAQKGGARSQRGEGIQGKGREHVKWDMYA